MGQASNLPPGCSSPDGGIDHEYEQALDAFCDIAETAEQIKIINAIAPAILFAVQAGFTEGFKEGSAEALASFDEAMSKAIGK